MLNFIHMGGLLYAEARTITKIEGFELTLAITYTLSDGTKHTKFTPEADVTAWQEWTKNNGRRVATREEIFKNFVQQAVQLVETGKVSRFRGM